MPSCNRREFLIRAGLVRPPIITDAQKERFVAATMTDTTPPVLPKDFRCKMSVEPTRVMIWKRIANRKPGLTAEQKAMFTPNHMSWNPYQKPGFARSIWVLLGWAGAGTVAWVMLAGMAMAWLSW